MNPLKTKKITSIALILLFTMFPQILLSQTKIVGELILAETSPSDNQFFTTVNGERAENGRSIMSTSAIATPSNINAKIVLPKVGSVTVSPNSKLELSFDSSSLSGNLQNGEFVIYSNPNISTKFTTPDGIITVPVSENLSSIRVKIVMGKTTVYSLFGTAQFNDSVIPAGDFYPKTNNDKAKKSGGNTGLIFAGIAGAIVVGVVLALSGGGGSSGGNDNVSPVR